MEDACHFETEGHVYILRLEKGKYYVGYSGEIETRIASHFLGNGSLWTNKHKPIEVISVRPGEVLLEDITTIAMMAKHGYQNAAAVSIAKWI